MLSIPDPKHLRIAYIGGGSRNWARTLMNDLALCPELSGEVHLYDIDIQSALLNATLGNWLQTQPKVQSNWKYIADENLTTALTGADFVFISIQPGTLDDMEHEIECAEKYGLFFPVGDTTGVPGLMRGLRSAILFEGFARRIAQTCPRAWVINFTNPMTICTRTLTRVQPELKVFGCCHEVFGTQHLLAELAKGWLNLAQAPTLDEIKVNVLGINHFTWIDRASYAGHDLLQLLKEHIEKPGVLRPFAQAEVEAQGNWFTDNLQIKFELFRRFGLLPCAGDRHLAEFVPGFILSPEELFRWGVICTPIAYRKGVWAQAPIFAQDLMSGEIPWKAEPSGEEMTRQLKALLGMGDLITNVNTPNQGQISNLPAQVVVETNANFSRDSVQPLTAGSLPSGVHTQIARHVANQETIIEAAMQRDKDLAFQAIFNDPTTRLPIDQAWALVNEIGVGEDFWGKPW